MEVIADGRKGEACVAALKGEFYTGKLASTGKVGVVEDYTKLEVGGATAGNVGQFEPWRWNCAYLGPKVRISRPEEGSVLVYAKSDAGTAQAEIGRLVELPVAVVAGDEDEGEEEEEDDRPLWQRRLEEEQRKDGDRFGPQGSDIP